MQRGSGGIFARLLLATALAGAAPLLGPVDATAAVRVYPSVADDGEPAKSAVTIEPAQAGALHLRVESTGAPSSDPGARRANGDGAEVCGLLPDLRATGTLAFTSFTADPGADVVHALAPDRLRLNQLDPIAPGVGRAPPIAGSRPPLCVRRSRPFFERGRRGALRSARPARDGEDDPFEQAEPTDRRGPRPWPGLQPRS